MEILRDVAGPGPAQTLHARVYGTFEEFRDHALDVYPCVMKSAEGAGSRGVRLAASRAEALRHARALSWSANYREQLRDAAKATLRKGYIRYSQHRRKFIAQEFLAGLTHDYKVLVFGDEAYVVRRGVRKNDFRASGSGKLSWPDEVSERLLLAAFEIRKGFGVPYISLDLAEIEERVHVLEMQFVDFGPVTLEKSKHHWEWHNGRCLRVEGAVEYEDTFARAVIGCGREQGWIAPVNTTGLPPAWPLVKQ